jgi:outer membrane protein assembly factor BamB
MGVRIGRVLIGVVAVAVIAAGVVFFWPDGDPAPAARPSRPKPTLTPLRLADSPLWTGDGVLEFSASGVSVVDATMLVFQSGARITAIDTASGKQRWAIDRGQDLTGYGGLWLYGVSDLLAGDSGLLMGWQHSANCNDRGLCAEDPRDQEGLALVSTSDGHVVWQTAVIPSYAPDVTPDTRPELLLDVMSGHVALVSIGVGMSAFQHNQPPARTMAVDTRTGATLWESQDPMWPREIVGDTVLGEEKAGASGWAVVALDLRTGKRTWTRPGGFERSEVDEVAGDVALVRGGTASGPERYVVVDAATGRTVTTLAVPVTSCDGDGDTVIACASHDRKTFENKVTIFRVDRRTTTTVTVDYQSNLEVDGGWAGRVQLSGSPPGTLDVRKFTMDSAGNVIDRDLRLPGRLVDLTGDRATFVDDDRGVAVYRVL